MTLHSGERKKERKMGEKEEEVKINFDIVQK
jgi:hypothetical protein